MSLLPQAAYVDRAWHGRAVIEEHEQIARDTWRIRLTAPEIARTIVPGQFVMVRLAQTDDPLLGRPLAVYDVVCNGGGLPIALDVVYLAVGKMTRRLIELPPGKQVELWGPLGNGFPVEPTRHLVMAAGGIGQTPFLSLANEYLGRRTFGDPRRSVPRAERVTLCYGARSADYLACVDDFRRCGVDVRLSTDDGSAGHHGLVTDLVDQVLAESAADCRVVCCGPEAMMKTVGQIAQERNLPCLVSLETPMACGIGVCFSCVAKIRDSSGGWDYRRTCVEGPVFDWARVVF